MIPKRKDSLDGLFEEWLKQYRPDQQREFHKDGIVDAGSFGKEKRRVLFVLLEPNSKGGRYDQYCGADLRSLFGEVGLGKSVDVNLARWTTLLLDGRREFWTPSANEARLQMRRVAIMNLKKLAGSGRADDVAISVQSWRDRKFIRREVEIIAPTLIVTCGQLANRLLCWIITADPFSDPSSEAVWKWRTTEVLPANHPSLRPLHAERAFSKILGHAASLEFLRA